jgi:hypothetical protein
MKEVHEEMSNWILFILHYCGIGNLTSVALEAQTNGSSPTGQGN